LDEEEDVMSKVLLVLVCLGLAIPACALGVETKIGYVNASLIFEQFSTAKEAQQAYEKEMTDLNKQVTEMEKAIEDSANSFAARKYLFSEERERVEKANLDQMQQDYVKFRQDAEIRASRRNEELTKPIVQGIEEAAKRVAEKEGFDLVLDASAGIVVYSKPEIDLTDKVLQTLEEAKQAGGTGQPGEAGGGQ
jgi:outer membrane protein